MTWVTFHDQPYVTHGGTISIHELPEGSAGDQVRHGSVKIDAPVIGASPDKVFLAFAGKTLIAASVGRRADGEDALLLRYADDGRPEQLTGLAACSVPAGGFAAGSRGRGPGRRHRRGIGSA